MQKTKTADWLSCINFYTSLYWQLNGYYYLTEMDGMLLLRRGIWCRR